MKTVLKFMALLLLSISATIPARTSNTGDIILAAQALPQVNSDRFDPTVYGGGSLVFADDDWAIALREPYYNACLNDKARRIEIDVILNIGENTPVLQTSEQIDFVNDILIPFIKQHCSNSSIVDVLAHINGIFIDKQMRMITKTSQNPIVGTDNQSHPIMGILMTKTTSDAFSDISLYQVFGIEEGVRVDTVEKLRELWQRPVTAEDSQSDDEDLAAEEAALRLAVQEAKTDTELLALLRVACGRWVAGADTSETQKSQFCNCIVLAITTSIPTIRELRALASDFGIPALQQFQQRPQGTQPIEVCFA